MLFNKYILAVTIFLVTIVSVSASPQLGGIGQSGTFNGISLNDITPTKISLETEGKWFVEKKTISPVKIKLKQVEVNKIKNKVPAKIVERVGSKEILTGNVIKEIDSTQLTTSKCSSVETDVYKKALFDCSEGILYDDDKETTLITSMGKEHSSLEAEFSLEGKDYNNLFLKIDQTFEFPHQQKTRVFVKVDDVWKPVCNNVASGNHCNLGSIARNRDKLEVRLENYAREGASEWSVDEVSVFSPALTNINPIPTNIRPINPPPGGLILPGPFGEEENPLEEDENNGYLETEDVNVELDLSPEDNLPDEEVDSELEELVEIESIPNTEQVEESTGNPSKITGFAAADLVGNGGLGIGVIVLLVVGLIALRIRMKKKRFIVP